MKLVYWVAPILNDSEAYNIRAKTLKQCKLLVSRHHTPGDYGEPFKVETVYDDAFDLMCQCLGECRGNEYRR